VYPDVASTGETPVSRWGVLRQGRRDAVDAAGVFLAAVAVEGAGGVDELADGGERAAVVEGGARPGDELPGLVPVLAGEIRDGAVVEVGIENGDLAVEIRQPEPAAQVAGPAA